MSLIEKNLPRPAMRFPLTTRIQAYEIALDHGLHLVRDNHHLWAIRKPKESGGSYDHVWVCSSESYDGLWNAAIVAFREPDFDVWSLPYSVGETETAVLLYDPVTDNQTEIPKVDLRRRRNEI